MLLSTRVRLVTRRMATISPEVKGSSIVTAITFSPIAVWYTARPVPSSLVYASATSLQPCWSAVEKPVDDTAMWPCASISISSKRSFSSNCSTMRRTAALRLSSVWVPITESWVESVLARVYSARAVPS